MSLFWNFAANAIGRLVAHAHVRGAPAQGAWERRASFECKYSNRGHYRAELIDSRTRNLLAAVSGCRHQPPVITA